MSYSLKLIVGVVLTYTLIILMFGFLGQAQLEEISYTTTISDTSINDSEDISIGDILLTFPSFIQGLVFTISGLPTWLGFLFGFLGPFLIIIGIFGYLRGI